MPLPVFPELPDDDPIQALRLCRNYLRDVTEYFSPINLAILLICLMVCFCLLTYLALGFELTLSWASDSVPLAFAVVVIVFSIKRLRGDQEATVIAVIMFVGLIGSVILHAARVTTEQAHKLEVNGLREKIEAVGTQNGKFLAGLINKPLEIEFGSFSSGRIMCPKFERRRNEI